MTILEFDLTLDGSCTTGNMTLDRQLTSYLVKRLPSRHSHVLPSDFSSPSSPNRTTLKIGSIRFGVWAHTPRAHTLFFGRAPGGKSPPWRGAPSSPRVRCSARASPPFFTWSALQSPAQLH